MRMPARMQGWVGGVIGCVRRIVLGEVPEVLAQLQHASDGLQRDVAAVRRELETQQLAWRDPALLQPLVAAVLRDELTRASPDVMAALKCVVERQLSHEPDEVRQSVRVRPRWPLAATAVLIASLILPRVTGISEATPRGPGVAAGRAAGPVVLEQRGDGFGLGRAQLTDEQLAALVRLRLGGCHELAGARVSFSVKDGWVWLRGVATPRGRRAAEQALAGIDDGVFVVNQLVAPSAATMAKR